MATGVLKAHRTWPINHVHSPRFRVGEPPRDIMGVKDRPLVLDRHQAEKKQQIEHRDETKWWGKKDYQDPRDSLMPPEVEMPLNQGMDYYVRKAQDQARNNLCGAAYWYYLKASQKAKKQTDKNRWQQSADSCLRTYRSSFRYSV
jgi:hypothetical protein